MIPGPKGSGCSHTGNCVVNIGRSRTYMQLLRTAHLGQVSVTVWPKILKDMCAKRNIHVLE